MSVLSGDALGHGHALFFGLVCQHGPAHHVAHRPYAGQVGLAIAVHHNGAALVQLQAHGLGVQSCGIGCAANRHNQLVDFQRLRLALGIGIRHADATGLGFFGNLDCTHLHAQRDLEALLIECPLGLSGDLFVGRTQKCGQAFQDGHFRSQPTPYRPHFQADHTSTDHAQFFWGFCYAQCAGIGQNGFLIERDPRKGARAGTRGDDDLGSKQGLRCGTADTDVISTIPGGGESARSMEKLHLVFLEQVDDASVVLFDHLVLAGDHGGNIHLERAGADAVLGKMHVRVLEVFGALQQGLGWNAAHIGTGAAWSRPALRVAPVVDASHFLAQLRCTDGRDVAAGAGANDDDVEIQSIHGVMKKRKSVQCASLSVMTPPMIMAAPSARQTVRVSPKTSTPIRKVPAPPMPVQAA